MRNRKVGFILPFRGTWGPPWPPPTSPNHARRASVHPATARISRRWPPRRRRLTAPWHDEVMDDATVGSSALAERLGLALASRDVDGFAALLSEDVTWGDESLPRRCLSRRDVISTLERALARGVTGRLTGVRRGSRGLLCEFDVDEPSGSTPEGHRRLFHVYVVHDDLITEIQSGGDAKWAAAAAGVTL